MYLQNCSYPGPDLSKTKCEREVETCNAVGTEDR